MWFNKSMWGGGGGDGSPIRQRWWLPSGEHTGWWECRLPQLLQIGPCCTLSSRSGEYLEEKEYTERWYPCLSSLVDLPRNRKSPGIPFYPPHHLIINWQCTFIAESLSQGTKHKAHKREGSVCREPATIKTLLIKITDGTNQQLKLIVFIVPRVKKLTWLANEPKNT